MRILFLSALTLLVIASPAAALLTDQEPSNDSMSTAAIQVTPSILLYTDGGTFSFSVGGGDLDFVGIGAQKAGTNWLAKYLTSHPQVCFSPIKELHYFDWRFLHEYCGGWHRDFSNRLGTGSFCSACFFLSASV